MDGVIMDYDHEVNEDESGMEVINDSMTNLKMRIDDEQAMRNVMLDDMRFATLDQWPADLRRQRETDVVNGHRPCLTIDQINQYITQVANDMAANRPSVKIRPVDNIADPGTAQVMQGLVRHIEDQSSAHIAYQTAGESAVTIGMGYIRVDSEYTDDNSGNQELVVRRIPDPFTVYLGFHVMPDGSDADRAWVLEKLEIEKFKRLYPDAKYAKDDFTGLGVMPIWRSEDTITVCEYFYKDYEKQHILFLADGRSMTKDEYKALPDFDKPEITGNREFDKVTVKWCRHTGCEPLEERTLKGKYIPIIEMVGKEKIVDGKRMLWGLVKPAKDSLRAFNYWISAMTEKMALSPKAPFIGAVGQFASHPEQWDKANVNNYAKLEYDPIDVNGNALPAPRRQEPMQIETAMVQMLSIMQNNVKSSLGMYKASVGDTDSQQSGRAILALKKESDTGTSHFGNNQAISVTHVGRVLVDLIPFYYDTKRVLRILGEDGKPQTAQIDPELTGQDGKPAPMRKVQDQNGKIRSIYNFGAGKYDVTVTVGPGYTTSRQEAATIMTDLANSAKDPVSHAILQYGAIKNSDFHGSEEIMHMLKAMLPPQVKPPEDGQEPLPPEAMQKIAQLAQAAQGMQQKIQELGQENQQLKSGAQVDMAKVTADHEAKMKALQLDELVEKEKARIAQEKFEFEKRLEIEKANHAIDLDERKAGHAHKLKVDTAQHDMALQNETSGVPQVMQGMTQLAEAISQPMQQFAESMANMQQTLQAILQATLNPPPREVSIGAVKKDSAGRIVGASIATKINQPATLQ